MIGDRYLLPVPCVVVAEREVLSWRVVAGKEVEWRYTHEIFRELTAEEQRDA